MQAKNSKGESYIGRSIRRTDAMAKVTGTALYPGDLTMEGMAHMKVLFARRPHARILRLDISRAKAVPGVLAVLTARDVPVNNYGIETADQPVLCEDVVRFVGDRLALVVAETEETASYALGLISVELEDLPVVDSPQAAMAPGAPILHAEKPENVLTSFHVQKGDVHSGFTQAEVIVEETYTLGSQEHAYLQPDAGLAWVDEDGRVVVKSAGQWALDDRRQIARSLDLREEQVRILYASIGGAFGGREDLNIQILLALAAMKVQRPVKAVWDREETTIGHHKRHPMQIHHKWGATRQGKLVAQQIEIVADAGAYASTSISVVGTTVMLCTGPYEVPNVLVDARAVYTNNMVSGAFRGFGAPQAVFAAEAQMARLAELLDMDPVELRLRNLLHEDSQTGTMGVVPPGLSARETLEAAAKAAGWREQEGHWIRPRTARAGRYGKLHGLGIAIGWKPSGYTLGWQDEATATVELHGEVDIERAVVRTAAAEMGQGVDTAICQMAAQWLDIPPERIELTPVDTAISSSAGPSSASRMTLMAGNALRGAVEAALVAWQKEERPAVALYTYKAPLTQGFDSKIEKGSGAFAMGYLAQAAEIDVDLETGQISVRRIISAHDVGKAINPQAVEGQIEGGAIQGLGWATIEDFIVREGEVLTSRLSTYLIPTVLDIPPEFEALILEKPSPIGPWGAIGVGEMPLLAVAPAISSALHDATGVWCNQIPMTSEIVWRCLKRKGS